MNHAARAALLVLAVACRGPAGAEGIDPFLRQTEIPPGAECPGGGTRVEWGADDDASGALDDEEIDGSSIVCDGKHGMVQSAPADPASPYGEGLLCGPGAFVLQSGIDDDGDGALQGAEIDAVSDPFCPNPITVFVGPQANVPQFAVTGWEECFREEYDTSGVSLADLQAACPAANLMLACQKIGSPAFRVLAHAPRADVFYVNEELNTPHVANGSGWYFSDTYSWGFAPAGAPIDRYSCDVVDSEADGDPGGTGEGRLCWHTWEQTLQHGWRCGVDVDVEAGFERVVLQADF